jgi:hypothetical protein
MKRQYPGATIIRKPLTLLLLILFPALGATYAQAQTFSNSYIVTTREQPGADLDKDDYLHILPGGKMFFCLAPDQYDQQPADYSLANDESIACKSYPLNETHSSIDPPDAFIDALEEDLKARTNGTGTAHLAVYVHGLAVTFPTAISEAAQFGLHFQGENIDNDKTGTTFCTSDPLPKDCILCPQDARKGAYPGLLIAFDWPSFPLTGGPLEEAVLLERLLAPATARNIRMRADESAGALANVFQYVVLDWSAP